MNAPAASDPLDVTLRDFSSGQKVFRRYTLKRTLGRGGMGVVWLARDDELERDVALKFLPELIVLDRALLANLKRETKRSLELTHKNIVRIYDFVNDETSGCISMEYIDGDTLSNMRADKEHKVFETRELPEWIKQLCEALDYAHNHVRVAHRDLKPSNLMVNQRGNLKVADFGIARSLGDSMSMLTMGARGTSGTLVYMSPQQLDGERGTPLDDVYSFGATIYELLTTKPPFYSGNIDRQIHERVPPPMNHRREELEVEGEPIDETWEKLVAACLRKDPARRPQSVREIADRLTAPPPQTRTRWLTFSPARKTRPSPPTTYQPIAVPRPPRVSKKRFRRATLAVLAGAKALLRPVGLGLEAVKDDFHNAGLFIIAASKAIVRGMAAGINAIFQGLRAVVLILVGAVTTIARGAAIGITTIVRGVATGISAIIAVADDATVVVAKAIKAILRAAAAAAVVLSREAIRGTAIVLIPALAVAAGVWFFALRPPPKQIVKQAPQKAQLSSPLEKQAAPVLPESKPPPVAEGGLSLDTAPAGATVIVDGSIVKVSPASLSNLAVGKHQLQIVLEGYRTEQMEVDVKEGQVASLGLFSLVATGQLQSAPTPKVVNEALTKPPQKAEQKSAAAKKPARNKQASPVQAEKPAPSVTRQAAASPPPPAKSTSKPALAPKSSAEPKHIQNPFGESAPGG